MTNKRLNPKQVVFCREYANGRIATEAYLIAYPQSKRTTAGVNSNKFIRKVLIQETIKKFQDENNLIRSKGIEKSAQQLADNEFADVIERKKLLTDLMRGKLSAKKIIGYEMVKGQDGKLAPRVISAPDEPNHNDRMKAIAELNKMGGDYAPDKHELSGGIVIQPLFPDAIQTHDRNK